MWRSTEPVASQDKFGEELHAREGQEDMVSSNKRGITGERQDQAGADRHLGLQDKVPPVPTQQREELRGKHRIGCRTLLQQGRQDRQKRAGYANRDDHQQQCQANSLLAGRLHRRGELRDALQTGERQE